VRSTPTTISPASVNLTRGPRFRRLRALLYRKYPQYPAEAALEETDSVIVEVTPTHVFTWGLE
jgi:hypothetical protein